MDIDYIETKIDEICSELEMEVMQILQNQSLDKKDTNLRMKPLVSTKKILTNALDSIKMVQQMSNKASS